MVRGHTGEAHSAGVYTSGWVWHQRATPPRGWPPIVLNEHKENLIIRLWRNTGLFFWACPARGRYLIRDAGADYPSGGSGCSGLRFAPVCRAKALQTAFGALRIPHAREYGRDEFSDIRGSIFAMLELFSIPQPVHAFQATQPLANVGLPRSIEGVRVLPVQP